MMKISFILKAIVLSAFASSYVFAAEEPVEACAKETERMTKSQVAYEAAIGSAQQETGQDQSPPGACLGGKVQWRRQNISLHIPQFKMNTKSWSTKIPETKMANKSFKVPVLGVECHDKTVGWKPEIKCKNVLQCTPKLSPIITTICSPTTSSKEIKMGVPIFTLVERRFTMSFPEIAMKKQDYSYNYPRFYNDEGCVGGDCKELCEDITNGRITQQQEAFSQKTFNQKSEMAAATASNFSCMASTMQIERQKMLDSFDGYISVAKTTRDAMLKQNLDKDAAEQTMLIAQMESDKEKAVKEFDKNIEQLSEEQKKLATILVGVSEEKVTQR
jgi:hypothetical protein